MVPCYQALRQNPRRGSASGKHFLPIVRQGGGCYDSTAQLRVTVSSDPCHRSGRRLKALEVAAECKCAVMPDPRCGSAQFSPPE